MVSTKPKGSTDVGKSSNSVPSPVSSLTTKRKTLTLLLGAEKAICLSFDDQDETVMPLLAAIQGCFGVLDQLDVEEVDKEVEGNARLVFSSCELMEGNISRVPCSQIVVSGLEGSVSETEDDSAPSPLCSLPPILDWNSAALNWVLIKVKELKECVGISCSGYEEKFKALLIAIEAGQLSLAKSIAGKERTKKILFH